jgi:hypothetical protein
MSAWFSMIRVREVSTKDAPLPPVHQLPDAVRATKHTPVEVYTHYHDVLDLTVLEKRQQFASVVRDSVAR